MNYGTLHQTQDCSTPVTCNQWSEVTSLWRSQPWVTDATRSLARISSLKSDWDGQGSPPPIRAAFEAMNQVVRELDAYDLPSPHISPVSGGGLGIEWHEGQRSLTIEILPDGSIEYLKLENDS